MYIRIVIAAVLEPLFIAFKTPLTTLDSWAPIFDLVAGSIYCADVIINARTGWRVTHKSRSKLTLDDRQSLLFFAQTSYCWLALLALVPWILQIIFTITTDADGDVSWNESTINALQVLRLLRLVSLLMNFSRSKRTRDLIETNITRYVDAYFVYCCMLLALLLFATHLFACAWIFVASLEGFENSWIADVNGEDYIDKGQGAIYRYARERNTHTHTHTQVASCFQRRLLDSVAEFCGFVARLLESASERALGHGLFLHHHLYSAAFYFATQTFTSVGYGNIAATTVAEQWVATVGMVFGAFFFAFVTGQFAVVITTLVDSYEVRNACVCVCVSVRIPPTPKKSSSQMHFILFYLCWVCYLSQTMNNVAHEYVLHDPHLCVFPCEYVHRRISRRKLPFSTNG